MRPSKTRLLSPMVDTQSFVLRQLTQVGTCGYSIIFDLIYCIVQFRLLAVPLSPGVPHGNRNGTHFQSWRTRRIPARSRKFPDLWRLAFLKEKLSCVSEIILTVIGIKVVARFHHRPFLCYTTHITHTIRYCSTVFKNNILRKNAMI